MMNITSTSVITVD